MSNNKINPSTLAGFMELLPSDQVLFNQIMDVIRNTYEKYGFLPLDTPIIEKSEVLLAKAGGETEKQIYRFEKGDNDLSLRFDLTVPLAKYTAINYSNLAFPFKRYQIGKVYRGERPQRGRFREFYQCDIDIIGDGELNIANDAEIPSVIYDVFNQLNFGDFTICINNRKLLNGFFNSLGVIENAPDVMRIIDKIEKIGEEEVKQELLQLLNGNESAVRKIIKFILIDGDNAHKINELKRLEVENELFEKGLEEITQVINSVKLFGVPEKNLKLDLTIARGLDYYTGTVYETFLNDYKSLGSVCSGGRYDNLSDYYTNKSMPGVGISIGLTRLFYQLNEMNIIKAKRYSIADVLVVPMTEQVEKCFEIASEFRKNNINTQIYLETRKFKAKLDYANKLKIPYVAIIGDDEIAANKVAFKNMETGEQQLVTVEEAVKLIK